MSSARPAHPTEPPALGLAVSSVATLAIGGRHREARNRPHLAPPRLPLVLDVEDRHRPRRPAVPPDVRALIRSMSEANPLWAAPRIHGELAKLGMDVSQATVAKYMARRQRPRSQTWRAFLANHVHQIVAADFFLVPTATYRLLFVLLILAHDRRLGRRVETSCSRAAHTMTGGPQSARQIPFFA
jgi:hypothetical protein